MTITSECLLQFMVLVYVCLYFSTMSLLMSNIKLTT